MKSSIVCSLLVGAVVFAAASLQAQVLERLNFSGSMLYQLDDSTNNAGTVRFSKVKSVAFNNKRIIDALSSSSVFQNAAEVSSIPAGSWLVVDANTDEILVTNKNGFVVNLTTTVDGDGAPFARFDYTSAFDVFSGSQNISTLAAKYTDWSSAGSVVIQDGNGTMITLTGMTKFGTVLGKSVNNRQTENDSRKITGSGAALYQGRTAVSQGSAGGSGKGTVDINI